MAVVIGGVEGANGFGDEIVLREEPGFEAGDVNDVTSAARAVVGAREGPVILDATAAWTKINHSDLKIGESGHEGLGGGRDRCAPDGWRALIDDERTIGSKELGDTLRVVAAPRGGVTGRKIDELGVAEGHGHSNQRRLAAFAFAGEGADP